MQVYSLLVPANIRQKPTTQLNFRKKVPKNEYFTTADISATYNGTTTNALQTATHSFPKIPGIFLGIPLNILTAFFTYQHYGENIMTPQIIVLQFLIGIATYGTDKLLDAQYYDKYRFPTTKVTEYRNIIGNQVAINNLLSVCFIAIESYLFGINSSPFYGIVSLGIYKLIRQFLYFNTLLDFNATSVAVLTNMFQIFTWDFIKNRLVDKVPTYILSGIFYWLLTSQNSLPYLPFILLLDTTPYYTEIKKSVDGIKPFYVSFMWTLAVMILPAVIHDGGSYDIFHKPAEIGLSFLLMFSLTNVQDIADMEEDRINGIKTLPVLFGSTKTLIISALSFIIFNYFEFMGK
jgi:hypothetical protein